MHQTLLKSRTLREIPSLYNIKVQSEVKATEVAHIRYRFNERPKYIHFCPTDYLTKLRLAEKN